MSKVGDVSKKIGFSMLRKLSFSESKPAPTTSTYPWERAGLAMILVLVVAGLRRPAVWLSAQFWAEDASVFFVQAESMGRMALTVPHAGYHHLLMRLWAGLWVNGGAPIGWMPTLFMLGAVLAWMAVVLVVFAPSSRVRWPWAVVLILAVVSPSNELYFNLTNVQWVTALLWAFWWSAEDPRSKVGLGAQLVGMAIVGLTGVFAMLATPLMAGRALVRRTWSSFAAGLVCGLTAWVQWGVVRASPGDGSSTTSLDLGGAVLVLGKRVWGTLLIPIGSGGAVMSWVGTGLAMLLLVGTIELARREAWGRRLLGWWGFAFLVMGATIFRFQDNLRPLNYLFDGERYFFVPQALVLTGVIQVAAQSRRWVRVGAFCVLGMALAMAITRYRLPALPDNDWPTWAARIERGEEVKAIPITPKGYDFVYPGNEARRASE